jgi:hypothetical protein
MAPPLLPLTTHEVEGVRGRTSSSQDEDATTQGQDSGPLILHH